MPEQRALVVLPVSPWSERARWALDHHRLSYDTIVHEPFIGERKLKRLVGPKEGRATVPVLITGGEVITDSLEIARYADRQGKSDPLLPEDLLGEILVWNAAVEEAMGAGRALLTAALLQSPAALGETLPPALPGPLRYLLRPVARYGTKWFARKYELSVDDLAPSEAKLRSWLQELRRRLSAGPYLHGRFTYADILAATALQSVTPVADRYLPLGKATREVWTNRAIAADFPDLLAWRDQIYDSERRPRTAV